MVNEIFASWSMDDFSHDLKNSRSLQWAKPIGARNIGLLQL
jgi:hypothetical protein